MQLSYTTDVPRGYHGQKAEGYPSAIDTVIPSAAMDHGVVVVYDRTTGKPHNAVKLPAAAGDLDAGETYGIMIRPDMAEPGQIPATLPAACMRKGRAYVTVEGAVTKGTYAFVRHTANGALAPGGLRADLDTDKAIQVTGIKFLETTTGAALCLVEFDL